MAKKINDEKVSSKTCRGRSRLTLENTVRKYWRSRRKHEDHRPLLPPEYKCLEIKLNTS